MAKKKGNLAQLTERVTAPSGFTGFVSREKLARVDGMTVKSMSPMLKPANWPTVKDDAGNTKNAVLVGVFTKIFNTKEFEEGTGRDKKKKMAIGVEIVPPGQPVGVGLPVTSTLRTGLDIVGDGSEAKSSLLGRLVEIELLPERIPSKKGQAAWHFVVAAYPEGHKLALTE